MTTSRIVRGTKARVFLYISAVLIITGVIACYNNTLSQLDDARKSSEICHQQEENLSTQLQVISDYKQRLEKSLKTEKAEHQGTKTDLENRLNEAKAKHDRSASESSLRFNSVQQQLNLLQTRHDDFKEECSSAQNKQSKEINHLQAKLKEVQQELKKVETSKENLKTQYLQIVVEKENLEKVMKAKGRVTDNVNEMNHLSKVNLDLQRELDRLKEKCSSYDTLQAPAVPEDSSPKSSSPRQPAGRASLGEYQIKKSNNQVPSSSSENMPPLLKTPSKSTTASSAIKSVSQGSLNGARPLLMPTVTPKSPNKPIANKEMDNNNNNNNNDDNNVLPIPYAFKVPDGVVQPQKLQTASDDDNNKKDDAAAAAVATNDRYRNKMDSEQNAADLNVKAKVQEAKKNEEADNGANEVFDQPLHGYDGLGFGDDKNDKQQQQQQQQQPQQHNFHRQHIDALAMDKEANKIYDAGDYKDNMPLEENDPEEDDDGDDYDHDHLARQKDPAVRN